MAYYNQLLRFISSFSGGIFVMTHLLPANKERIKYNCAITIQTILMCLFYQSRGNPEFELLFQDAKRQFLEGRGIQVMCGFLSTHNNAKFLSILCDSLYYVAKKERETKKMILRQNGTHCLMQIIRSANYQNLIRGALKLFEGKDY